MAEKPYAKSKMKRQQDEILSFMKSKRMKEASPGQLFSMGVLNGSPLTSIRRSLTNMTTAGVMEKTTKTVKGLYGRFEHVWRICEGGEK